MSVWQRVVKPTTRKGKKICLKKEPQLIEGSKRALFFHGRKSSESVRGLTNDLYDIKKPDAVKLSKKNDITVFENVQPVENMCRKHETPLFMLGSHSKKRPDNLVAGRMFNYNLLDMVELHVESYMGLQEFSNGKITMGTKPCLLFNGPEWEESDEMKHLKSLFIDFFHKECVENIRLQGIEHTISLTVDSDKKIHLRSYKIVLKKSGADSPRVELEEIGPRATFSIRRSKLPDEDLMKEACRKPKEFKVKAKKNISIDGLGTTHGRIHVGKQNIMLIKTRKMKGLKKTAAERKAEKQKILQAVDNNTTSVNGHEDR